MHRDEQDETRVQRLETNPLRDPAVVVSLGTKNRRWTNYRTLRVIQEFAGGLTLYTVDDYDPDSGLGRFTHRGVTSNPGAAADWLDGADEPDDLIRVYPLPN